MTEKDLGRALLDLDLAPVPAAQDPRLLTQRILERDRRQVRRLAGLAALFWVVTAAGLGGLITFYLLQVTPRLRAYAAGRAQLQNDWNEWAFAVDLAAGGLLACITALLLAAVCTVLLTLLSRRATLRQINASLAEISEQLRLMRQPPAGGQRESTGTA
jgi:hypothetical protein